MCVIIHRKPGVTIPYDKLSSACAVNPVGMGIITVDRGKLHLRKYFWDTGNKPDVLAKSLEENIDHDTYVHLRFRTKGNSDSTNVHPFSVLKQKKHGMDLQFMHNGTLSDYGTEQDCDSKDFVKTLLTPLTERLLATVGPENITNDPIYNAILSKYAGGGSVFLLADNFGNHSIVNRKKGYEFDGWWASNDYSFDRYHREPTTYYTKGWSSVQTEKKAVTLVPIKSASDTAATGTAPFNDDIPFDVTPKEEVLTHKEITFPNRETFIQTAGIPSLSNACGLTDDNIRDMVLDEPELATLLIMDLLKELYDRDREYEDRADYDRIVA